MNVTVDYIIQELRYLVQTYRGNNILDKKLNRFRTTLVEPTDGKILKLFDSRYYKQLNVGISTVKKAIQGITNATSPITLEDFLLQNQLLRTSKGKDSRSKKLEVLSRILSGINIRNHYMVVDYYTRGINAFFGPKILLKMLKSMYPDQSTLIAERAQKYQPFQLYELYVQLVTNSLKCSDEASLYRPMLASAESVDSVDLKNYFAQPKLDGIRLLIRRDSDDFVFWTRSGQLGNKDQLLKALPHLKEELRSLSSEHYILDGQLWVSNLESGKSFQKLMPLVKSKDTVCIKGLTIKYTVFDVLMIQRKSLMEETYIERREKLVEIFKSLKNNVVIELIESLKLRDLDQMYELLESMKVLGREGLVVKRNTSRYTPNTRNKDWIKIKYECPHLDVVLTNPLMAKWGRHKNSNRYTSFEAMVLKEGSLVSLGRVGAGFKDVQLDEIADMIRSSTDLPIVELQANHLTRSPIYSSGFGLRFPRFVRYRLDLKSPNELSYVLNIFKVNDKEES